MPLSNLSRVSCCSQNKILTVVQKGTAYTLVLSQPIFTSLTPTAPATLAFSILTHQALSHLREFAHDVCLLGTLSNPTLTPSHGKLFLMLLFLV